MWSPADPCQRVLGVLARCQTKCSSNYSLFCGALRHPPLRGRGRGLPCHLCSQETLPPSTLSLSDSGDPRSRGNCHFQKVKIHSWSLAEVLGIGRGGKSEGLMEGEVRKLCVFADYSGPTWSQIRSKSAMVTYRSILRMDEKTLPKQVLQKQGLNNILVKNMMKRLGGAKPTTSMITTRMKLVTMKNSVKPPSILLTVIIIPILTTIGP